MFLRIRRLLKAAKIFAQDKLYETIKIDDNISIIFCRSSRDPKVGSIRVFIAGIDVLFATNLTSFTVSKIKKYKIPIEAVKALNSWSRDICRTSSHMRRTYIRKKKARQQEVQQKINSLY